MRKTVFCRWPRVVTVAAGTLLLSCSDSNDVGQPSPAPLRVDQLSTVEDLRIDGNVSDLVRINGVAVAPDGTIALVQRQDHLVRFFTSSGDPLRSLGREGEGPGEFRRPFSLGWVGDSLTVYDNGLERFTILGPQGGFGRTIRASPRPRPGPGVEEFPALTFATVMRLRSEGGIIAQVMSMPRPASALLARRIWFVRMDEQGVVRKVIAQVDEERPGVSISSGNRVSGTGFPFPNVPLYHLAADGSRFVVVKAAVDGVYAGTYLVTAIRAEGDTVFSRRYPFDVVEISKKYADSVIKAEAEFMEKGSPRLAAAFRRKAELPPMRPPVLSVLNGRDGTIWLQLYQSSPGLHYLMLDADGTPLAKVSLPSRIRVRVADREHVWATVHGEYGVQSLVRYRIDPR